MDTPKEESRTGDVAMVALATVVAAALPATYLYDWVMRWLRPIGHAEEVIGRGLETLFVGGPASTVLAAAAAGWFAYRRPRGSGPRIALGILVIGAIATVAILKFTKAF
jgi:hypothetical protein